MEKTLKTTLTKFNEDYNIIKIYTKETIDFYIQKKDYGDLYYICGVYEDIDLQRDYVYRAIGIAEIEHFWDKIEDMEKESQIDLLNSEKENLTRTLEECGEIISQAKEILEWLLTHNKNYTKKQYYKLLDLQEILDGE